MKKESKLEESLRKLDRGEKVETSGKRKIVGLIKIDWYLTAQVKKEEKSGSRTNIIS